jgi:transposase
MDGSPLEQLADDRRRLMAQVDRKTDQIRVVVVAALAAGTAEAALARQARVSRSTVREWAGKPTRRKTSGRPDGEATDL